MVATGVVVALAVIVRRDPWADQETDAQRSCRINQAALTQRVSAVEAEIARIGQATRNAVLAEALRRARLWQRDKQDEANDHG